MLKVLETAKVLPVRVFDESLHRTFVAFIEHVLEIVDANHNADWHRRTAKIGRIEFTELLVKDRPINLLREPG